MSHSLYFTSSRERETGGVAFTPHTVGTPLSLADCSSKEWPLWAQDTYQSKKLSLLLEKGDTTPFHVLRLPKNLFLAEILVSSDARLFWSVTSYGLGGNAFLGGCPHGCAFLLI